MFLPIQDLIAKAKLKGVAINIHARGEEQLNVVITPQLPNATETAHLKTSDDVDNYFALREALSSPLVFNGSPDELAADIGQFIDSLSPSMERASETLSATAQAAKLDAASASAATAQKTASKAPKSASKGKKAEQTSKATSSTAKTDNATGASSEKDKAATEQKPQDSFSDFDNLDSI